MTTPSSLTANLSVQFSRADYKRVLENHGNPRNIQNTTNVGGVEMCLGTRRHSGQEGLRALKDSRVKVETLNMIPPDGKARISYKQKKFF